VNACSVKLNLIDAVAFTDIDGLSYQPRRNWSRLFESAERGFGFA